MIEILNIMPKEHMYEYYLNKSNSDKTCIVMAHLILEDKKYLDFIKQIKLSGKLILLDNSAPYLGKSIANDLLLKCINLVEPDEVVLPDSINNFEETVERTINFVKDLNYKKKLRLIAVPQGQTLDEYERCYKLFSSMDQINSIGLSYTVENLFTSEDPYKEFVTDREFLISVLLKKGLINPEKKHHLLGFGNSGHLELKRLNKFSFITRCDSNAAYKLAHDNTLMVEWSSYIKPNVKFDFDVPFNQSTHTKMLQNINVLRTSGGLDICKNQQS